MFWACDADRSGKTTVGHGDPRPLNEVHMKTPLVALASASLLAASLAATPVPTFAPSHGGGHGGGGGGYRGGGGGGGGAYHGGGHYAGSRGGYRGGGYYGGGYGRGYYGHGYYGHGYYGHGYGGAYYYGWPYYAGAAAFGFILGSAFLSPWYYDYPPAYSYYTYRVDPGPPVYDTTPYNGAAPPAACGSWTWDTGRATYFWVPCRAPASPQPDGYVAPSAPPTDGG
jgi:hypothetical protein